MPRASAVRLSDPRAQSSTARPVLAGQSRLLLLSLWARRAHLEEHDPRERDRDQHVAAREVAHEQLCVLLGGQDGGGAGYGGEAGGGARDLCDGCGGGARSDGG